MTNENNEKWKMENRSGPLGVSYTPWRNKL